ncbi:DoxX family protein [Kitasatospora purpeofusca]|uniref:DoxX family protein n=1 Tax=Kitasatospora purpeofusca TaxID=67352 RepID=UPI002B1E2E4E|nr:DoxX family protein [Kitasatospora purpeofusca]
MPRSWWGPLALAKLAGAAGLLVGLVVPALGVAAAVGLILYFLGAVVTCLRARSYSTVPSRSSTSPPSRSPSAWAWPPDGRTPSAGRAREGPGSARFRPVL